MASSGTVFEWNVVISIEFNSMSEKITSNRSFSGTHLYLVVYGSRIKSFFLFYHFSMLKSEFAKPFNEIF